jgi:Lon protease-like protein
MTNFIPIFPLNIVVYPGESLNLHIFEPRYRQLIEDCQQNGKPFGIPVVLNNKVAELGTLVRITEVVQVYDDGKMDIRTRGERVFRVLEAVNSLPEKLYGGAIVHYPDNLEGLISHKMSSIMSSIRELHRLLNISKDFRKADHELSSYDIAHHAGLSIEEEYELLGLFREDQRIAYLQRHLQRVLPVVAGMESLKERVQLNGHFRELKGFNFDL